MFVDRVHNPNLVIGIAFCRIKNFRIKELIRAADSY